MAGITFLNVSEMEHTWLNNRINMVVKGEVVVEDYAEVAAVWTNDNEFVFFLH